jgi:hypothetical protein
MKSRYVLILLSVSVLAAGCISPRIQTGTPREYELPGLANTTIFYVNGSSVEVVESVTNTTSYRIDLGESGDMNVVNPVAVNLSGNNVSFNISREAFFGKTYMHFDFDSPFSGFVAYTQSQSDGQTFTQALLDNNSVRVILPANFTTGSRFLGIAQPEPDNSTVDASGRVVLIWNNPYPENKKIKVNYYHKNAPAILISFIISLVVAAFLLWGYYRLSIRSLRNKLTIMEKDKSKKK